MKRCMFYVVAALASMTTALYGTEVRAELNGRNCDEQCHHDYSSCGEDATCNKAKTSCKKTCQDVQRAQADEQQETQSQEQTQQ